MQEDSISVEGFVLSIGACAHGVLMTSVFGGAPFCDFGLRYLSMHMEGCSKAVNPKP